MALSCRWRSRPQHQIRTHTIYVSCVDAGRTRDGQLDLCFECAPPTIRKTPAHSAAASAVCPKRLRPDTELVYAGALAVASSICIGEGADTMGQWPPRVPLRRATGACGARRTQT